MKLHSISVKSLTVRLGDHTALEDISFDAPQGAYVAVLGPNGSGKTTLLKSLLGLVPEVNGELKFFELPLRDIPPSHLGYVPQLKLHDRSFPATSCDLVASGLLRRWPARRRCRTNQAIQEALELVGAVHLIHRPVGQLSGGELQRVYLARALIRKPRILFLDEPATGIDAAGEEDLNRILEAFLAKGDTTVLMVTHDWMSARHHATHALLINRRLIAFGASREVLTDANMRRTFGHFTHIHSVAEGDDA